MKVAIIVRKLSARGGTQRQALSLARELKHTGDEVTLYAFDYSREDCFPDLLEGMKVVSLPSERKKQKKGGYTGYLKGLWDENKDASTLACLIDPETELLNPHDHVAYKVAYYFKKNIRKVPSVWMMNDMPTRIWSFWREQQLRPELALPFFKRLLYWAVDTFDVGRFVRKQDAIVVLDNANKSYVKHYFGRDAFVVRSGLDLERFVFKEHGASRKPFRILTNGIFFIHRRFEDVIEALYLLRQKGVDATLSIIGDYGMDPTYHTKLLELCKRYSIQERVFFRGKVSDAELIKAYQDHDAFVFANVCQTWGLAVFEAMACGIPTLVSKGAGAHEVLSDGTNALLVAPRAPEDIASQLARLENGSQLSSKLSKEGRMFVEQNISWQKYAEGLRAIFSELKNTYEK